jgi:predicted dehydrogenase
LSAAAAWAKRTCRRWPTSRAATDLSRQHLASAVDAFGLEGFDDAQTMFASGSIDAAMIATPHTSHPQLMIQAMEHGLHVLCEKPVAITASAAQQMNDAAERHPRLKFAVMYQFRSFSKWRAIHQLIEDGRLGALQRVTWIATSWFRPQAYFDSASWRATWAGEGGGLLMNQLTHNLDMLCWLTGMPSRVTARLGLGKFHDIEVDDEVVALLDYPNGATGMLYGSTGEAPGCDRLELIGDRGRIVVADRRDNAFQFDEADQSISAFRRTYPERTGLPDFNQQRIETDGKGGHEIVHQNFIDAILDDVPLLVPGVEGIRSVELSNAITMSGISRRPVDLPIDRDAYDTMLEQLIDRSAGRVQSSV